MAHEAERRPPAIIVFLNIANTITHLVLGAVAMSAFIFAMRFSIVGNSFNNIKEHIYLCVTGYVILMAQAILVFSPHTGWSISLRYQDKKIIHWVMQVTGAMLAIAGSITRITKINNNPYTENFQTAHGIFGLVAMVLTIISLLGGVANLYLKALNLNFFIKIVHCVVGSLTITSAFVCLCLGFNTQYYRVFMGDKVRTLAIALTVTGLLGVLMSAFISNFKNIINRPK